MLRHHCFSGSNRQRYVINFALDRFITGKKGRKIETDSLSFKLGGIRYESYRNWIEVYLLINILSHQTTKDIVIYKKAMLACMLP
jgi:hypothetical protein